MNITVTIQAPELSKAIESLAFAIANSSNVIGGSLTQLSKAEGINTLPPSAPSAPPIALPIAPIQSLPETQTAVPTAPVQQPVQTAYLPSLQQPVQQPVQTAYQPSLQQPVQQPVQPPVQAAVASQQVVPTTAPSYSMEQLAVAATQIMDAGRRNDLVQLLASFGIQALTALPKEQYGTFATKLREMGAKI